MTRIRKKLFRMTLFPLAVTMISFILCLLKALVRKVNSSLRGWKGHLDVAGDPAPSLSELNTLQIFFC